MPAFADFWRSLFAGPREKAHYQRRVTIAVLGDGGVGKTCLSVQFCHGRFVVQYDPTVSDRYTKSVRLREQDALLEILDTAGQEEFLALQDSWIRSADGFLIVYAVDSPLSFNIAQRLHGEVLRSTRADDSGHGKPIMLVGNKKDLPDRIITTDDLRHIARTLQCRAIETSAKLNSGVEKAFMAVADEVVRRQEAREVRRRQAKRKGWF